MKLNFKTVLFLITLILVISALSIGFFMTGGPKHQRKVHLDIKRAKIISQLSHRIDIYYKENKKLPKALNELPGIGDIKAKRQGKLMVVKLSEYRDPETEKYPDYKKLSDEKFELCMTFLTSNLSEKNSVNYNNYNYNYRNIKHDAGHHCAVYYKNNDDNKTSYKFKLEE